MGTREMQDHEERRACGNHPAVIANETQDTQTHTIEHPDARLLALTQAQPHVNADSGLLPGVAACERPSHRHFSPAGLGESDNVTSTR